MYQMVIVDDEEKIVEGIANLFPWEQIGFSVTFLARQGKHWIIWRVIQWMF